MSKRSFHFLGSIILGATLISVLFGNMADAISAGGIGGRPAKPDLSNPRTQSIFIMTLDKGGSKKDTVKVVNGTGSKQTIKLYAVDGMVTNTGAYTCRQEGDAKVGLGGWTKLDKNEVVLEANTSTDVDFTVNLPDSADVGEHNGCIVFQSASQGESAESGVNIQMRQAIRLVVTVPGNLHREVSLKSFRVDVKDGSPVYSVSIQNVGNVSVDTEVEVKLRSALGKEVYSNGGGYPVLANQKLDLKYEQNGFSPLFGGWYKAQVAIKYNKKAGTFGTGAPDGDKETITSDEVIIFLPPSTNGIMIIAIVTLAILTAGAYLLWRRIARDKSIRASIEYRVKSGETIKSIAERHKVSWKEIATMNSLKPPYVIEEGWVIRVPRSRNRR